MGLLEQFDASDVPEFPENGRYSFEFVGWQVYKKDDGRRMLRVRFRLEEPDNPFKGKEPFVFPFWLPTDADKEDDFGAVVEALDNLRQFFNRSMRIDEDVASEEFDLDRYVGNLYSAYAKTREGRDGGTQWIMSNPRPV